MKDRTAVAPPENKLFMRNLELVARNIINPICLNLGKFGKDEEYSEPHVTP
jgi:hypothetical protein